MTHRFSGPKCFLGMITFTVLVSLKSISTQISYLCEEVPFPEGMAGEMHRYWHGESVSFVI